MFWPRANFDYQIQQQAMRNSVKHHAPEVKHFTKSFVSCNFAFNENQCRTIVLAYRRQEVFRKRVEIPYLFRTYENSHRSGQPPNRNLDLAHHIAVWQVARATTASPTFFRPVIIDDHQFVSGGFRRNNPCAEIYKEIQNMDGMDNVDIMLSIGTGNHRIRSLIDQFLGLVWSFRLQRIPQNIKSRRDYRRLDIGALGQLNRDQWQAGGRVRTNICSLIGRHRSKKNAAALGQGSRTAIANSDNPSVPTFRNINFNIAEWFQPRDVTEESIRKHTRDYLDREYVQSEINKIAKILVEKRRDRVKNIKRWEKFCCETWYQCKVHDCPRHEKKYSSRRALQIHILDKHSDKYSRRDQGALEAALDEGRRRAV